MVLSHLQREKILFQKNCLIGMGDISHLFLITVIMAMKKKRFVGYKNVTVSEFHASGRYGRTSDTALFDLASDPGEYIPGRWENPQEPITEMEKELINLEPGIAWCRIVDLKAPEGQKNK